MSNNIKNKTNNWWIESFDIQLALDGRTCSKYRVSNEKQYQSLFVAQIFIHESFKLSSLESDVAIIVLESGMKLTNSIWPICISEDHHIQDGTSVTMTGEAQQFNSISNSQ
eukprot:gene9845-10855_t